MNTLRAVTLLALITAAASARATETEAGVRLVVGAPVGEFDDEVARKTNDDDFATYWGGGGGLLIPLVTADRAENRRGVFLDLKATYQRGAEAEFLTEGDITIVGDVPVFNPSQSRTDMASYQLGVVVTF